MKIRFYTGVIIALVVGVFFANGVISASEYSLKLIKSKNYAIYESENDLGASVESDLSFSQSEIIDVENDEINIYHYHENPEPFPNISSKSYLVADLDTGQLIKQKNRDQKYPIASITKLITALVSLDTINQKDLALVSRSAINTYGKQGGLYSGQRISVYDLLYPLLLESSNDAAEVLAEHSGRKIFMENMNGKAKSIGLANTYFDDPSGLSPNNTSTADDLFKLIQYLYKKDSEILEITKLKDYKDYDNNWFNISDFKDDTNYLGGKNGYTDEAYYTLVSAFELPLSEKENRRIAIILLKGQEPEEDTRDIIRWLLDNVYYE